MSGALGCCWKLLASIRPVPAARRAARHIRHLRSLFRAQGIAREWTLCFCSNTAIAMMPMIVLGRCFLGGDTCCCRFLGAATLLAKLAGLCRRTRMYEGCLLTYALIPAVPHARWKRYALSSAQLQLPLPPAVESCRGLLMVVSRGCSFRSCPFRRQSYRCLLTPCCPGTVTQKGNKLLDAARSELNPLRCPVAELTQLSRKQF